MIMSPSPNIGGGTCPPCPIGIDAPGGERASKPFIMTSTLFFFGGEGVCSIQICVLFTCFVTQLLRPTDDFRSLKMKTVIESTQSNIS